MFLCIWLRMGNRRGNQNNHRTDRRHTIILLMKNAFHIALREYLENARTKGFWISILALPLVLLITSMAPSFLEDKAIPTRHFLMVDPDQRLEPTLLAEIFDRNHRDLYQSLKTWLNEHAESDKLNAALEALDDWHKEARNNKESGLFDLAPFLGANPPEFSPPRSEFSALPISVELQARLKDGTDPVEVLKPYLLDRDLARSEFGADKNLFALIFVPSIQGDDAGSSGQENTIQYWSLNPGDGALRQLVSSTANKLARENAFTSMGLDASQIQKTMQINIPVLEFDARKKAGQEQVSVSDKIRQWAPSAFVYLLFVSLFAVMQMLLNSTIEEKSNRLMEILLASVRPEEIMIGKLLGNGMAGLTLIGVWMLIMAGFGFVKMDSQSEISQGITAAVTQSNLIPAFLLYFLLGFLIYSGLFLTIGSLSQTIKDAQSYTGFFMIIMIVPLMTMFVIPRDPNGVLAVTMSWIPIYTPFVMLNRLSGNPPAWEIAGTSILCGVTIILTLVFAARVFKRSIISGGAGSSSASGKKSP